MGGINAFVCNVRSICPSAKGVVVCHESAASANLGRIAQEKDVTFGRGEDSRIRVPRVCMFSAGIWRSPFDLQLHVHMSGSGGVGGSVDCSRETSR